MAAPPSVGSGAVSAADEIINPPADGAERLRAAALAGDADGVAQVLQESQTLDSAPLVSLLSTDDRRETALHAACRAPNAVETCQCVLLLLRAQSDPDTRCGNRGNCLHQACQFLNADVVDLVLAHLRRAVSNVEQESKFLQTVNKQCKNGWTPLHAAVYKSADRIHQRERGTTDHSGDDANDPDRNRCAAIEARRGRIVKALLEDGADSSLKNTDGDTAMQVARHYQCTEGVMVLERCGVQA